MSKQKPPNSEYGSISSSRSGPFDDAAHEIIERLSRRVDQIEERNRTANLAARELHSEAVRYAPINFPTSESLTIDLVPADLIFRLEEHRADEIKWNAIMWTILGAVLGVIINWSTSDPLIITRASLIVIAILTVMAAISGTAALDYKRRADAVKTRIDAYNRKWGQHANPEI